MGKFLVFLLIGLFIICHASPRLADFLTDTIQTTIQQEGPKYGLKIDTKKSKQEEFKNIAENRMKYKMQKRYKGQNKN